MNQEQALQVLTNLSNLTVQNGGIYQSIDEPAMVKSALQVLTASAEKTASLEAEVDSMRAARESDKTQIAQLQQEIANLKSAQPIV